MSRKQKILVVANRTADSPELIATLCERAADAPAVFTLLEVVVSVLPRKISRWLAIGLPARLRRAIDLPVVQVTADPQPQPTATAAHQAVAA